MMIFEDETITPERSELIRNTLKLTDALTLPPIPMLQFFNKRLNEAAGEYHESVLFQSHENMQECPICMLPLPIEGDDVAFRACCGNYLCLGCLYRVMLEGKGLKCPCPFCRSPPYTSNDEYMKWLKRLTETNNPGAICQLASHYNEGSFDLGKDQGKAIRLWKKSGQMDSDYGRSYYNIASSYLRTKIRGNVNRIIYYFEKAAIKGSVNARVNVGRIERDAGNMDRATRHFKLAAEAGHEEAMNIIWKGYRAGDMDITRDDFNTLLRRHHDNLSTMTNSYRDKGRAIFEASGVRNGV
mmetsp:Transcript_36280/g.61860  ORF Transcript_36280/g.61860 Transcript_36280/m.61860 type:complete len:298 (-) Transcript_36280:117-1010(-)